MNPLDDISIFFTDLAVPALVGTATPLVLFNDPSKIVDEFSGQVATTTPSCLMQTADVAANHIVYNTVITINDVDYGVIELQPDGTGMTLLQLTKDF